jgi:hypothetical protein
MSIVRWLALVPALVACSAASPRTRRSLQDFSGVLFSNSPMLISEPEPALHPGTLLVSYVVLVENHATKPVELRLSEAVATIEKHPVATNCGIGAGGARSVVLQIADRARVECRMRVSGSALELVSRGDRELELSLPVVLASDQANVAFSYWLRIEDAT